jgi:methyltransferase (TIGR00027 family)
MVKHSRVVDDTEASRTAVLVCQGRAVAQGRLLPDRFDDPIARRLLRDDERDAVDVARNDDPPKEWQARMGYEMLRANAQVIVPRTITIDDAVRDHPTPQVVILGAGLDGRAWRMGDWAAATVFEVDHPASQADKQARLGDLVPRAGELRFVPVDFTRDSLDEALAAAHHLADVPTTWIWEGVVAYLTPAQVRATLAVVDRRSVTGSRLIVNYQSPSLLATGGRLVGRLMTTLARRADPLKSEPRRSAWTPARMSRLLDQHRFTVGTDEDLLTLAHRLGLMARARRSLGSGRVVIADR